MDYTNLHLETIALPDNLADLLAEEACWEDDRHAPFLITVNEADTEGKSAVSYQLEFSPSADDFEALNKSLQAAGHDPDGYGWTDYLLEHVAQQEATFGEAVREDSESETCVLYTLNQTDFWLLLREVSAAIRALA